MLRHIPFYGSLLGRALPKQRKTTACHVLVYGAIEAHSMGEYGCIAGNKVIAAETGLKEATVKSAISELLRARWIDVIRKDNKREIVPKLDIGLPEFPPEPEPQPEPEPDPETSTKEFVDTNPMFVDTNPTFVDTNHIYRIHREDILEDNSISLASDETVGSDNIDPTAKPKRQRPSIDTEFKELNEHWTALGGRRLSDNKTARDSVRKLLAEHGLDDIKVAIQGAVFYQGKKYKPQVMSFAALYAKWDSLSGHMQNDLREETSHAPNRF